MKHFRTNILIYFVMILGAIIFSSISFAGTGAPEGPPTTGLTKKVAKCGKKDLCGTIMIEYGSFDTENFCYNSNIILRLSKGDDLQFFKAAACLEPADADEQTDQIIGEDGVLKEQILQYFFGNTSLTITLMSFTNFHKGPDDDVDPIYVDGSEFCTYCQYVIADVVLAVE